MANERGKSIDKTHLSIDTAEERGFIHRDYIAHCLRWSHVIKWLNIKQRYKRARILDVGCGKEVPMAKTLYSSRYIPEKYVGVDVNKLDYPAMFTSTNKFPLTLFDETDFGVYESQREVSKEFAPHGPNVIVSFEVLEHVEPEHSVRLLVAMYQTLATYADDGFVPTVFISTPCWDPHVGAAANHVNEVKYQVLGSVLEELGFTVKNVYGTFASQKDIEPKMFHEKPSVESLYEELKAYYDSNYIATIFAPLFPEVSRNCLWELTAEPTAFRKFPPLAEIPGPWSSSEKWADWDPAKWRAP